MVARNATTGYYVEPFSLNTLQPSQRRGMVAFSVLGCMSVILTVGVIGLITKKIFRWHDNHRQFILQNQYMILIMNLLFADLNQGLSFTISIHWLKVDGIFAPTGYCWAQAGLLHIGDVSSGFFVLTIALHTLYMVLVGKRLGYYTFCSIICSVWAFSLLLTIVGPLRYGEDFFADAGNWCWISQKYNDERLWLHYFWVFIDEFGTVLIYLGLFVYLQLRMRRVRATGGNAQALNKIIKAARYMLAYAVVYVVLTLPLAVGRMMALSGTDPPNPYLIVSGALLTSCGWLDAILYTMTRRVLIDEKIERPDKESPDASSDSGEKPLKGMMPRLGHSSSATGGSSSDSDSRGSCSREDGQSDCSREDDLRHIASSGTGWTGWTGTTKTSERRESLLSLFNNRSNSIFRKTSINIYRSTNRSSVESGVLPPELAHYHNWGAPAD